MVQERNEEELPVKVYETDDSLFVIKCKGFTLERFEERLCTENMKAEPLLRDSVIDRFLMFRTKPKDGRKIYRRADLIKAWDEFKEYLFKAYKVE